MDLGKSYSAQYILVSSSRVLPLCISTSVSSLYPLLFLLYPLLFKFLKFSMLFSLSLGENFFKLALMKLGLK